MDLKLEEAGMGLECRVDSKPPYPSPGLPTQDACLSAVTTGLGERWGRSAE